MIAPRTLLATGLDVLKARFRSERAFGVRSAAVIVPGLVLGVVLDYVAILRAFPLRAGWRQVS